MRLQRNAANAVAPRVAIIDAEGDYGHVHVMTSIQIRRHECMSYGFCLTVRAC
jgi:hypothetical protein